MNQTALTDFGTRYAAAWSSQNPVSLASFYTEKGSLTSHCGVEGSLRRGGVPTPAEVRRATFPLIGPTASSNPLVG